MLSLIPQNTKNLAHCDYHLRISEEDSWPLQYFFYDYIMRRHAFKKISGVLLEHPTKDGKDLLWNATPLGWIQVFGMEADFSKMVKFLTKQTSEDDFQSQDRLAYIGTARQFMRSAFMVTDGNKVAKNLVTFVSAEVSQSEFDTLIEKRYIVSNAGWPIGSDAEDDKKFNGINIKTVHCPAVEKALLGLKHPAFTTYAVNCVLEDNYEERYNVFNPAFENLSDLRVYYTPARQRVEAIHQGEATHNRHYTFLEKLLG